MQLVSIAGLVGHYVAVDRNEPALEVGEYLSLPDDRVFKYQARIPRDVVILVDPDSVPEGARVVEYMRYSPNI